MNIKIIFLFLFLTIELSKEEELSNNFTDINTINRNSSLSLQYNSYLFNNNPFKGDEKKKEENKNQSLDNGNDINKILAIILIIFIILIIIVMTFLFIKMKIQKNYLLKQIKSISMRDSLTDEKEENLINDDMIDVLQ